MTAPTKAERLEAAKAKAEEEAEILREKLKEEFEGEMADIDTQLYFKLRALESEEKRE